MSWFHEIFSSEMRARTLWNLRYFGLVSILFDKNSVKATFQRSFITNWFDEFISRKTKFLIFHSTVKSEIIFPHCTAKSNVKSTNFKSKSNCKLFSRNIVHIKRKCSQIFRTCRWTINVSQSGLTNYSTENGGNYHFIIGKKCIVAMVGADLHHLSTIYFQRKKKVLTEVLHCHKTPIFGQIYSGNQRNGV